MKKVLIALGALSLASSPAFAVSDCAINTILNQLRPGASFSINTGNYADIQWTDPVQSQPSLSEYNAAMLTCTQTLGPTTQQWRTQAISILTGDVSAIAKFVRAVLMVLFDENNVTRGWIQAYKVQVAASTSFADFQSRVAALPNMPDRTMVQAINAVQNKLNSGASD